MKILLVSATSFEIAPFQQYLSEHFASTQVGRYWKGELEIIVLITGIGLSQTSFALGKLFALEKFDLAIQAGVAGAFDENLTLGTVVHVVSERFGDVGVEEADGRFTDMHELDLIPSQQAPFSDGLLMNQSASKFGFLPKVKGLSVNKVHGFEPSISSIQAKYEVDVESMEGAAFFYACLMEKIPFIEIRAISNRVEARSRANWKMGLAIEELNKVLIEILEIF